MDEELRAFLRERFDAVDRRLDRIERALRSHGCEPCGRCESCRRGGPCERCRDRCRDRCHDRCRCHRPGRCCREGTSGLSGGLRALGEAQAVLGAFERARDDRLWREVAQVQEAVHLLSRRVSAVERRCCYGESTC